MGDKGRWSSVMEAPTPREVQQLLRASMQTALPSDALGASEELKKRMDVQQYHLVRLLREQGVSWDDIARPVGITRQALQRRWARWESGASAEESDGPD
jgi:DNA invertase Pin-like site-specific DNA recombinase